MSSVSVFCDKCNLRFNQTSVSRHTTCATCRSGKAHTHGTEQLWARGCHCDPCNLAHKDHRRLKPRPYRPETRGPQNLLCIKCNGPFVAPRGTKYCGKECRGWERGGKSGYPHSNHSTRARYYGVAYEGINKYKVYERDDWNCGICGEAVNPELKYPHRQSVSIDCIIPMSRGGSYTYDNVQCSHLRCNVMKGGVFCKAVDTSSMISNA